MKSEFMQRKNVIAPLWCMFMLAAIMSCEKPIKLAPFINKGAGGQSKNPFLVQSVPYQYTDKIVISWKKVRNAASYFLYEFKNRTDTLEAKTGPDYILGVNTLQHTIKLSNTFTEIRYVIVVAMDSANKALFTSDMIEGKTLGKPTIHQTQIQKNFYSISFAWSPIEGVSRYAVERKKQGVGAYKKTTATPMQDTNGSWVFVDEDVEPEMSYDYRVLAYVANGQAVVAESNHEFAVQTPKQDAPSAVKDFATVEHAYSDRVLLVWNGPDELDGKKNKDLRYVVERREKSDAPTNVFKGIATATPTELQPPTDAALNFTKIFNDASVNPTTSLVYQDTTVEVNKIYEYRIRAKYGKDEKLGKPSLVIHGAVIPQASNLSIQAATRGVLVQWSVPSDFTDGLAEVYRSKGGLDPQLISTSGDIVGNSYTDAGPHVATTYTYEVRLIAPLAVIDKKNRKDLNKGVFSQAVAYEYPNVQDHKFNFSISRGKKDSLKFSWSTPEKLAVSAGDFSIHKEDSTTGAGTFNNVVLNSGPTLNGASNTGEATLVVDPKSYKPALYKLVFAHNGTTTSSRLVLGDVLRAPQKVSATKAAHAQYITVRWQPSVGAKKYEVELRERGKNTVLKTYKPLLQNGNKGEQKLEKLTPPKNHDAASRGTEYDISVVAIGEDETSDRVASDPVQGSTFGPVGIRVSATKGTSINKITVTWNTVPHAEEYAIVRKNKATGKAPTIATVLSERGKTSYTYDDEIDARYANSKALPLEKIYFQVYEYSIIPKKRGVTSNMPSEASEGYLFASPRNVVASDKDYGDKILLTWEAVGGASEYVVHFSDSKNGTYNELASISAGSKNIGNEVEYEHTSLAPQKKGYYKVTAKNTSNNLTSRMPDEKGVAVGYTLGLVTGVQASDVDYKNNKGIYIAKHEADAHDYDSKGDIYKINRTTDLSYATKITWNNVPGADKYYIYRMDFNKLTNVWRKIGERKANEARVFFDTKALVLREYRALYWVVAFAQDKKHTWNADASLSGDPNKTPTNTVTAAVSFTQFDAAQQTQNIQAMSKNANVDVGSRWITPREYLNWSLAVIGDGVYDGSKQTASTKYGVAFRSSWGKWYFTLTEYSLGAKAKNITNKNAREKRKTEELVIKHMQELKGTGNDRGGSFTLSKDYTTQGRLVSVQSPYGEAFINIKDIVYDFSGGTIEFAWNNFDASKASAVTFKAAKKVNLSGKAGFEFSQSQNTGAQGALNPHVMPLRFNRDYKTFLKAVYDK